jgi:prepilin-type N-terminal cleavage/methylation domain-containing protein
MPRAVSLRRARRAFSLVELLLAMVLVGIVGAILARAMVGGQWLYDAMLRVIDQRAQLRDAAAILPDALRAASVRGGDLIALSDSAIELRATIATAVACDVASLGARLELVPATLASGATLAGFADAPQPGDEVVAYDPGTRPGNADDAWRSATITSAGTTTAPCASTALVDPALDAGRARWRLDVAPALPTTVRAGAPVRVLRAARYRLYRSGAEWWLGYAERVGGAWSTVQPVSGPLRAYAAAGASGLSLAYRDSTGAPLSPAAAATGAARIEIVARAVTRGVLHLPGRPAAPAADSIVTAVALRNAR